MCQGCKQCNLRLEPLNKYCLVPIIWKGQYPFQENKKRTVKSSILVRQVFRSTSGCQHALLYCAGTLRFRFIEKDT
jgi:hypothetical protein